jgi:hypothetical protein
MDNEFINIFIAKQKALIDELINKTLLQEAQIGLFESNTLKNKQEIETLKQTLEVCQKELIELQQKTKIQKKEVKADIF